MKDKKERNKGLNKHQGCMIPTLPETFQSLLVGVSKTNILCVLPAPKSANLMVGLDLGQGNKTRKWKLWKKKHFLSYYLYWTDKLECHTMEDRHDTQAFLVSLALSDLAQAVYLESQGSSPPQSNRKTNFLESLFPQ